MARTSRLWVPMLVGLLVAGLLGVGGGGAVAVEPRVTVIRTITIPPAAFQPQRNEVVYRNLGNFLFTEQDSQANFLAPLVFEAPVVYIRKITLNAYDAGDQEITLSICRTTGNGYYDTLGFVKTQGASGLETVTQRVLSPRRITGAYGPYLELVLPAGVNDGYSFQEAKVTYSYEAGA